MPTVTQLIEAEDDDGHIFESILQIMLSYVKYGEIKYGEEPLSDERIQTIFHLLPELDSAITNPSGKARWNVVNLVLIRCWEYIQDYIELCKRNRKRPKPPVQALPWQKLSQNECRLWQAVPVTEKGQVRL